MAVLAATIVTFAACVICVIGLAIPYWIAVDLRGKLHHLGLWQTCIDSTCQELADEFLPDWWDAVRAMEILGFLISGAAVLLGLLKAICMKDTGIVAKLAGVLALIAGALMIIGIAIFAAKKEARFVSADLHAGFVLCIISGAVSFVGGVLFLVSRD